MTIFLTALITTIIISYIWIQIVGIAVVCTTDEQLKELSDKIMIARDEKRPEYLARKAKRNKKS